MTEHFEHCYIHEGHLCSCGAAALERDARAVSGEEPYDVLYAMDVVDGEIVRTAHYNLSMLEAAYAENETRGKLDTHG